MKKIIFYTIKSVQDYCFTFCCQLKTGFSNLILKESLIRTLNPKIVNWRQSFIIPLVLTGILITSYNTAIAQNIKGIVPVATPKGGSGVDGDAWAHEPIGTIYESTGDLFDKLGFHTDNHGVLDLSTGNILYPGFTFFLQDRYVNDLTIFTSSNKINDNPNTYTWGPGSSPNKNEIQNAGAHFSYGDPSVVGGVSTNGLTFVNGTSRPGNPTDLWCLFAADRQVTNGSSYIDFEFLQKPLTITGATFGTFDQNTGITPITGGSGGFTTQGTDGGRTVGDILITIEFTQGGGDANVVIRVWTAKAGGGFEYVIVPNTSFPGNIFCTNNNVTTTVPFDAYGVNPGTYAPNQWAEGAINLTEVFKNTGPNDPCFNISTLFIRTRSSGNSAQSELKDFPGAPIQLNLNLIPIAAAGADFTKTCTTNPDGKQIGETPEAGFTYSWSPTTGLDNPNIANPIANPSVTTTYTVTKTKEGTTCSATDDVLVTVDKPTVVAVAGADFTKTCTMNASGGQIGEASQGGYTYSWTSSPTGFTSTASNPTVNPSVTTTYTVTKTHTASGCSDTDEVTVTVNKPEVVANAGTDFTINCLVNTSGGSIGEASQGGYTYSWTSSPAGFTSADANPTVNPSVTTTYTVTKTHTASGCSDTDEVTVTVNKPTVVAVAGDDFTKTCTMNASGGQIGEALQGGYTYSWTSSPAGFTSAMANPTVNPSVTTTYTVTKTHTASGCSDTDEVTVTVNKPEVVANAGTDFTINCLVNTSGGSIGEASQGGYTYSWTSSPAGFTSADANPTVNPSVTTTYTVTKTHTASGCSDTDEVTVTVNKPTVVAVAGDDFTKTCTMNSSGGQIGEASQGGYTYSWTSSPAGFTSAASNPTVNPSVTTTYTVTKTHTASGCSDTDEVTVTVNKPEVTANAGTDFTINCLVNTSGGSIGEASQGGYTYSWTSSPAGFTSTDANPTVNPSVTTTYTVTKTHTASGCSDTDEVTVTVNKPTVVAVAGDDFTKNCLMNSNGGQIGEASQEGYTYSWTSSPAGFTSAASNPTVNPSVTTTYTVTKTHTSSGCSDTDEVTVTVNKPEVTANAGDDFTKTCTMNTNGGQIGEVAQAGYTYSWTSSPAGFTSTDANPTVNPSVTTTYTVTKTHTASGCSDTDEVTVTVNIAQPTPFTLHNLEICSPLPVSLLSAIQEALPDPLVESVTFWRDPQAMNDQITGNDITNFAPGVGSYTIYIKEILLASGCPRIQQFSVDVKSCSAALCTYTQGYYGNSGGMSCAEGNPYTTAGLIAKALASYGGTMTVGSGSNKVWMMAPDDIDDIIRVMPGGGPSKVLSGDIQISSSQFNKYLKNGRINNALLAQTIALGLNIGINGALGNFELKAGTFAVAEPEGGCGSDIPKTRQCSPGGFTPVINEFKYYTISQKVVDAISPKTVQGLFALANQALGGGSTNGLTLSEITAAVDLINNAFDECRIFVGYNIEPLVCAAPVDQSLITTDTARIADTSTFTATPVPFKDQLTISYDFDYVTDVKIEVFNTSGYVVASSYDTNGYLTKSVTLNIPYTGQEEVYVIVLTTNRGSSTKKVLSSR